MNEKIYFQIEADFHRKRLDDFLFDTLHSLSKMYLRERLKEGFCEVNGFTGNAGVVLKTNDFVEIELNLQRETAMKPENIPLEIIYEEESFLIVNKPTDLLVHPTHSDRNGTLLNGLSYYLNPKSAISNPQSKIIRPGLIHRLDKQTSGLMVIAKDSRAHRILSSHFQRKLVEKKYLALVEGIVENDSGEISAPIGRYAELKFWSVKTDGKESTSKFQVVERFADSTLLELEPVTGRTNQLRIHCEYFGHPIVGDIERGGRAFSRLCLHAHKLVFWHPNGKQRLEFISEMPEDFIIMKEKEEIDTEKSYSTTQSIAKLRRLADALEQGKSFEIQIDNNKISVPPDARIEFEYEKNDDGEEIEIEISWK